MAVQTEAILAVSFGTSHNDTRERTIDRIEAKLQESYPEFEKYAGECYFKPCYHAAEPRCRVLEAVAAGEIDAQRHARYAEILVETRNRWRERYD